VQDTDNREFTIKINGNKDLLDLQEMIRKHWGYKQWIKIASARTDGKEFFLQDGASYTVAATYDADADTRPAVKLRIDLPDRTYFIPDFRLENDPAEVVKILKSTYGFPLERMNQVQFSPISPENEVKVTIKSAISCSAVKLEPFTRRTFRLFIADDRCESDEIILPSALKKSEIWTHLQTLHAIPDVTQFQVVANRIEISGKDQWPAGLIEAVPLRFPVNWRIENPQSPEGFIPHTQNGLTPLLTVHAAWGLLHDDVPNLFEKKRRLTMLDF
jgi:hypothetical protein